MAAKILVVDDSATYRLLLSKMLSDYNVITACDGREALQYIDSNLDLDLIILDLNMPNMNGFQVLETLKTNERYKKLNAIILTDNDEPQKEIMGLRAGAVDYIRKPINVESLRIRIDLHLTLRNIHKLSEKQLEERSITLDAILEQAPIGIAVSYFHEPGKRTKDNLPIINHRLEVITGRTREELVRLGWGQITHPDELQKDLTLFKLFTSGVIDSYTLEKRYIKPDGSAVWVEKVLGPLRTEDSANNFIILIQDISERKEIEEALTESERSKSVLLSNLPGMAYRCKYNHQWTMSFVSEGCLELTGYTAEELVDDKNLPFNDVIVPEYREELWNKWAEVIKRKDHFKEEYEITTAAGQRKWVLEIAQGVYDEKGNVEALEGIIIDITDRKEKELRLKHLSERDDLSGLYNRRYLESRLQDNSKDNDKSKKALIIIYLKKINYISLSYGYSFCENLLKLISSRLRVLEGKDIELFKVSFERFAFHFANYKDSDELTKFACEIINILEQMQIMHTIGCCIGAYEYVGKENDAETIIKNASLAAEKTEEKKIFDFRFYDDNLEAQLKRELEIKMALVNVIGETGSDSIFVQYQPMLNLKTNRLCGFEALARMKSEKLGFVPPNEFIKLAEDGQHIVPIGKKIMRMACEFQKKLESLGYCDLFVSVNVSPVQLIRETFVSEYLEIMQEYNMNPAVIGFELTESAFSDNDKLINDKLKVFLDMGMKISVDDFGTGYSSLSRESELNANCLKIDKSFIDKLLFMTPEKALTGDIISMAHKLDQLVIAEGVETVIQKQYLKDNNCDILQGFLYSRPLSEEDAISFTIKELEPFKQQSS